MPRYSCQQVSQRLYTSCEITFAKITPAPCIHFGFISTNHELHLDLIRHYCEDIKAGNFFYRSFFEVGPTLMRVKPVLSSFSKLIHFLGYIVICTDLIFIRWFSLLIIRVVDVLHWWIGNRTIIRLLQDLHLLFSRSCFSPSALLFCLGFQVSGLLLRVRTIISTCAGMPFTAFLGRVRCAILLASAGLGPSRFR